MRCAENHSATISPLPLQSLPDSICHELVETEAGARSSQRGIAVQLPTHLYIEGTLEWPFRLHVVSLTLRQIGIHRFMEHGH